MHSPPLRLELELVKLSRQLRRPQKCASASTGWAEPACRRETAQYCCGPAGRVYARCSAAVHSTGLSPMSSIGVRAPCRNVDCTCSSFSVSIWGKVVGSIFANAAAAAAVKPPVSAADMAARERAIAARVNS